MHQDTSTPPPSAPPDVAPQGSPPTIPLRAQLSLLRQRIILTLRYVLRPFYRLPIDDIREQNVQAQIDGLLELCQKNLETIQTLARVSNNTQLRLACYEQNIPRMRELKRELEVECAKQAMQANGNSDDLGNGILPTKPSSLILRS